MRGLIVFSRRDEASMQVRRILMENFGLEERLEQGWGGPVLVHGETRGVTIDESHLYAGEEWLASLPCDLVVVASIHRSEKGVKGLLTHATGNWGAEAPHGGRPYTLSATMAGALRAALETLHREASGNTRLSGWEVGLEVTHHGPYSPKPLIYVEYGGDEGAIDCLEAAQAVGAACLAACRAEPAGNAAIGLGGSHYAPKFTRLMTEGEFSFGHIAPRYAMPLSQELVRQALERVVERPRIAVLDWKGLPSQSRQLLSETLSSLGVEVVKR